MRYQEGTIKLSPTEDGDILRQVLRSRFITHEQLWKITAAGGARTPRSTFNWRLQRLVQHQLLKREQIALFGSRPAGTFSSWPHLNFLRTVGSSGSVLQSAWLKAFTSAQICSMRSLLRRLGIRRV